VRLDEVAGEHLAGGEFGDRDLVVIGERADAFAGVLDAGVEVVHPSGAAEGSSWLWCRGGRSGGGSARARVRCSLARLSGCRGRPRPAFDG
jgi:hypothetical protein